LRHIAKSRGSTPPVLGDLLTRDSDERVSVAYANRLLYRAVLVTKDPCLGLKTARESALGDFGVLDFATSTADTVEKAIEIVGRYQHIIDDTIKGSLVRIGARAVFRIESSTDRPRAAVDFLVATLYRNHVVHWPRSAATGYDVWLTENEPKNIDEYHRTYYGSTVHFAMPFNGFVFMENDLYRPLPTADPRLNRLMIRHAERVSTAIYESQSLTGTVRRLISNVLPEGGSYCKRVSASLDMSIHCLIRRLENEGTTFREIVEDVRRRRAMTYVCSQSVRLADIAFLLGYSQPATFNRAFRRWTGQTPADFRRSRER
jgi:AraC-like DNA-binding protein